MMGGKQRKRSHVQLIWMLLILLALVSSVVFAVGAMTADASQPAEFQGTILEQNSVLPEHQALYPRSDGGYALVSSGNGTVQITMLNGNGAPVDSDDGNIRSFSGIWKHSIVQDGFLYLICSDLSAEGDSLLRFARLPLDGSLFSQMEVLEQINYDEIDPVSIGIQSSGKTLAETEFVGLAAVASPAELAQWKLQSDVVHTTPIRDETGALIQAKSLSVCNGNILVAGTVNQKAACWTVQSSNGAGTVLSNTVPNFPLTVLSADLLQAADGCIYRASDLGLQGGGSWKPAAVYGNRIAVISDAHMLSLYSMDDFSTPMQSCTYSYPITAMTWSDGGILVLFSESGIFRAVCLDPQKLSGAAAEPEQPTESSEVSSETVSDGDPANEESSPEEPENPQQQRPDHLEILIGDRDDTAGTITLPEGITLAQFRTGCVLNGGSIQASRPDGSIFTGGKLGTGVQVAYLWGEEAVEQLTVIIPGDLNGSGTVNSADVDLLFQHLTRKSELQDVFLIAADLDQDTIVDTRDLLLLQQ